MAVGAPQLWLATNDYEDAPQKLLRKANLGTEPPVSDEWRSPWIGSKVEDVAEWMKQKPSTVDLDDHHFALLGKQAGEDHSVVICRIGDGELKGDSVHFKRYPVEDAAVFLVGMEPYQWEGNSKSSEIKY